MSPHLLITVAQDYVIQQLAVFFLKIINCNKDKETNVILKSIISTSFISR